MEAREIDLYGCSLAQLGIDLHVSTGLLHEAEDLAETKSGSLSDPLRREERIERFGDHIRRHATTCVGHRYHHILPRLDRVFGGISIIKVAVRRLDREA